jgi:NACHT domain-containing protein/restriction endonuclease
MHTTCIRILEKDNNRRGDLFGRLMADLFVALGFDQPRLNIHKSGRELDLDANHRLERRRAIAECKATEKTIGGGDVNKFVGILDVEHGEDTSVTGYFISLAGFKQTAVEQEKKRRRTKLVLLTGREVVAELVNSRILISRDQATELAGRCCAAHDHVILDPGAELLAHDRGWIWAIYYTQWKARTHFALIHADGTPLDHAVADQVIAADTECGGHLKTLICLNPTPPPDSDGDPRVAIALAAYGHYLAEECGFFQLDGLPADGDVGSRRLRLENLFVPLHLDVTSGEEKKERQSVGTALADHPRLALLAAPGGGKSTLIKRLAVAYADPVRREQIADDLPPCDWFPLFFRCRELRGLARNSFAELLDALAQREGVRLHAEFFRAYVDRALLAGRGLLLVDGLDEISDPGDRAAFVCTLRTALHAYPGTALVVTSREAGFRHVAAHLAAVCTHATLSPFDSEDIRRLSVAWHREVVGDSAKVRADAEQLAVSISANDRIGRLAVNPLLLTTLLLVKRWVGSLPTRRAALYDKAVELLLMTWNTEGHVPIPQEEALPQLCYVASAMMLEGVQKISRPRLAALLQEARHALPTELGYVQGTVDQFIHRVEDRSSLLMMTGHDVEDGRLVEFFEFRHLTFQEFLTARAMVEGWHPGRKEGDTLVAVLEPHFQEEKWREVIPLAAVLGGKATEALIERLTVGVRSLEIMAGVWRDQYPMVRSLGRCLADEAAARPETIRAAVREVVRLGGALEKSDFFPALVLGRYSADLRDAARKAFLAAIPDLGTVGDALSSTVWFQTIGTEDTWGYKYSAERFLEMLTNHEMLTRCEGALGFMELCYRILSSAPRLDIAHAKSLGEAGPALSAMLLVQVSQI